MDQKERADLEHFESLIIASEPLLSSVLVSAVVVRPENSQEWYAHLGMVEFVSSEHRDEPWREDYEDLRLVRVSTSTQEGLNTVRRLATQGEFDLGEFGTYSINGRLRSESYRRKDVVPSGSQFSLKGWPSRVYRYEADDQGYNYPNGPFLRENAPVFSDLGDAATHWLGGAPDDQRFVSGRATVWARVGEYRGRIAELRVQPGIARLQVGSTLGKVDHLIAHALLDGADGRDRLQVQFPSEEVSFALPTPCNRLSIYLVDRSSGDLVDYRHIDFAYAGPQRDPSVRIEHGPDDIDAWLGNGENQWIEFKAAIVDDDLLETVVSFANGEGGRILVGVDDNGRSVGFGDPKGPQRVQNLISGRVDPVPKVDVKSLDHHGKTVLVIDIPTGENQPYLLRERGVFIRSGSTDRVPTRAELEHLMKPRQSEILRGAFEIR